MNEKENLAEAIELLRDILDINEHTHIITLTKIKDFLERVDNESN